MIGLVEQFFQPPSFMKGAGWRPPWGPPQLPQNYHFWYYNMDSSYNRANWSDMSVMPVLTKLRLTCIAGDVREEHLPSERKCFSACSLKDRTYREERFYWPVRLLHSFPSIDWFYTVPSSSLIVPPHLLVNLTSCLDVLIESYIGGLGERSFFYCLPFWDDLIL